MKKQSTFTADPKLRVSKLADDEFTEQHNQFINSWLGEEEPDDALESTETNS